MTKAEKGRDLRAIVTRAIIKAQSTGLHYPMDLSFEVVNQIMTAYRVTKKH